MKLSRFFSGIAPALAVAALIGLAVPMPTRAQSTTPTPEPSAAPAPAASATPAPAASAAPAPAASATPAPDATAPAAATPAPAAAGAKPAPPATPACAAAVAAVDATDKYAAVPAVPAVLTNCTPTGGDTAWMLTSVALVLMMTIPGLGLFYGGMVRKKNVGDTVMTSFAITALITVIYAIVTYSLSFTPGNWFIGGFSRVFLQGILSDINNGGIGNPNPLAPTIPETVYMCFQMTFAIITPALIAGSFAERMKFSAMLWFIGLWALFDYAPVAHWVWGPDGMFSTANVDDKGNFAGKVMVLDFAGGTVVHINAGVAGLMSALMLGKRRDTGPGHNMVLCFIGTGLLWVGWFGFNAGSAVSAGVQAGMAMTVTQIATAVAALTWMFVEWAHRGKPTVIGICSGAVAGLVAITPASGYVGPGGSMVIGVACGVGCYLGATSLKHAFGYDDALDAFGVHAVGGIIGAILTGVFVVNQYGGHTGGYFDGNWGQVLNQCIGVGTVIIYDTIVSLIILKVIDMTIGLRVSDEVERDGLDLALHGEIVQ